MLRVLYSARRSLHASAARLREVVVKVPGMGDSITEGTLISFPAPLGSRVRVDDVVAVIETDKVRAPLGGGGHA